MKILLAVDGSEFTKKMLSYLSTHPELFGKDNHYTALTVRPHLPGRAGSFVGKEAVDDYHQDEAEKVLTPVREFLHTAAMPFDTLMKVGPLGETIADVAESGGYGMIVMGSHGHGSLANLVMGSVANKVIAESKVPVLLVL